MAEIKVQQIYVSAVTSSTTLSAPTDFDAVGSLDNAFIMMASNTRAGVPTSTGNTEGNDFGVNVRFTATDGIAIDREASALAADIRFYIVEYTGASGGDNEFLVRHRATLTPTAGTTPDTLTLSTTPTNVDDCIPFYSASTSLGTDGWQCMTCAMWLSGTNTLNYHRGGFGGTTSIQVEVVEFTGSNWSVGHGDSGTVTADTGTITLNTDSTGTGGSTFDVTDWNTAFIWHAFKADHNNDTNDAIADNSVEYDPTSASTTQVDWYFHSDHDAISNRHLIHVLKHADLNVTRYSNSSNTAGETTIDITSAGLTDLGTAAVIGSSSSSGAGTAYARGMRNYYLNSLTQAAHWCGRSGNTMGHRLEVLDFEGIVSSATQVSGADAIDSVESATSEVTLTSSTSEITETVESATSTTIEAISLAASSNISASGESTTRQLTTPSGKVIGDFVAGRIQDDENPTDNIDIGNDGWTELEWSLIASDHTTADDIYEFRVTVGGQVLDTYTVTPEWTIGSGGTTYQVSAADIGETIEADTTGNVIVSSSTSEIIESVDAISSSSLIVSSTTSEISESTESSTEVFTLVSTISEVSETVEVSQSSSTAVESVSEITESSDTAEEDSIIGLSSSDISQTIETSTSSSTIVINEFDILEVSETISEIAIANTSGSDASDTVESSQEDNIVSLSAADTSENVETSTEIFIISDSATDVSEGSESDTSISIKPATSSDISTFSETTTDVILVQNTISDVSTIVESDTTTVTIPVSSSDITEVSELATEDVSDLDVSSSDISEGIESVIDSVILRVTSSDISVGQDTGTEDTTEIDLSGTDIGQVVETVTDTTIIRVSVSEVSDQSETIIVSEGNLEQEEDAGESSESSSSKVTFRVSASDISEVSELASEDIKGIDVDATDVATSVDVASSAVIYVDTINDVTETSEVISDKSVINVSSSDSSHIGESVVVNTSDIIEDSITEISTSIESTIVRVISRGNSSEASITSEVSSRQIIISRESQEVSISADVPQSRMDAVTTLVETTLAGDIASAFEIEIVSDSTISEETNTNRTIIRVTCTDVGIIGDANQSSATISKASIDASLTSEASVENLIARESYSESIIGIDVGAITVGDPVSVYHAEQECLQVESIRNNPYPARDTVPTSDNSFIAKRRGPDKPNTIYTVNSRNNTYKGK